MIQMVYDKQTDRRPDGQTDRNTFIRNICFLYRQPMDLLGLLFFCISPCQLQVFIPYTLLPRLRIFYVLNFISQFVLLFSLSLICERRMFPCFVWRLFRCSRCDYNWCFCGAHFDARNHLVYIGENISGNLGLMYFLMKHCKVL